MTPELHLVHGMAGNQEPAHWPALTPGEVAVLLGMYPAVQPPFQPIWHSPRPLSAACLVQAANRRVFVKRHHLTVRTPATLGEEHAFMDYLRRGGVPIPEVLADADGARAVARGEWVYEVHAAAPGLDLYRDTPSWVPPREPAHAHSAGAMLGALAAASAGYQAPQRGTQLLVARADVIRAPDPVARLRDTLPQRPALARDLARRAWERELAATLAPWHAQVQPRLAALDPQWTHGDWHVSNLCWDRGGADARVSAVLDFGLAARTFALFDLATAIERNAIAWLALDQGPAATHADVARALIAGYRERRPLAAADVHLVADLLPIVHVDFALSELEYLVATGHDAQARDTAYDTFLRGHAAWFTTPAGQMLRAAICACA